MARATGRTGGQRGALGRFGEDLAVRRLAAAGTTVLERNWRCRAGEIDIVARRGDTVAFIEVKARADRDSALAAIDGTKRRRIARAAAVWLARNAWAAGYAFRGDAVLIVPRRWPCHVVDAFPVPIG